MSAIIFLILLSFAAAYQADYGTDGGSNQDSYNLGSLPKNEYLVGSSGLNYLEPAIVSEPIYGAPNGNNEDSGITVTEISTFDVFSTKTETLYNSVPVTLTEFVKSTVTVATSEVLRTAVDDAVTITTVAITRPLTQTVTDVSSVFSCVTEVSTDVYTITHVDQRVLQTTLTSTIVQTHTFRPTIVQTRISTEVLYETETIATTNTAWVEVVLSTRYPY